MANDDAPPIISTPTDPTLQSLGRFLPGTQACFFFTFTALNGQLYDPFDFNLTIVDSSATELISSDTIEKIEIGKWTYNFFIPTDTTPGKYTLTLEYQVETLDGPETETFTEDFLIVESASLTTYSYREITARAYLDALAGYIQRIPLWDETVRFNKNRSIGELSFPRWNQSAGAKVYLNGEPLESGYTIDYGKGRILFTNSLSSFDEVTASYNFRWFTDDELSMFIQLGIQEVNMYPPQTTYTLGNIEDRWFAVAMYAAIINVYRRWMNDILFVEPAKIFGSLQRAQDVFNNMETLKKNYEGDKTKLLELKKFGPYTGLTKTITVPEFTLPGGRCLAYDTKLIYLIDNTMVYESIEFGFHNIDSQKNIFVLSDNKGSLSFEPVSKIWKSGKKPLLRISDANGNHVDVSEDHIMFVNEKETPASNVKVSDVLTIISKFKIVQTTVTSIENVPEQDTYDIEVPTTENLFANNIKCHNSRWFRYLFKGA